MENINSLLPCELKAEFAAASLLENGLLPEQIVFKPLGAFKRRSHADIENSGQQQIGNFEGLVLESNRNGIYDYLPEQLFHISAPVAGKTLKKKIEDIRAEREKEQKTRLFFLPLEQEYFFSKVWINQIEHRAGSLQHDSLLFAELRHFWQIPMFVSDLTFIRFLSALPEISECRADFEKAENMLSSILSKEVTLEYQPEKGEVMIPGAALGSSKLGIDFLSGGCLESYLPVIRVNITCANADDLEICLTDTSFDNLTHWLLGWFLPVEYDYYIHLTITDNPGFILTEKDLVQSSRLGYTSILAEI